MVFNIISSLILIFVEQFELTLSFLLISVTFTALAISLSSAIIFSMIMDYSRKESRAVDYAIQSSLFSFTRIISAVIAGVFVSNIGFEGMFLFEFIGMVLLVFIIYRYYK